MSNPFCGYTKKEPFTFKKKVILSVEKKEQIPFMIEFQREALKEKCYLWVLDTRVRLNQNQSCTDFINIKVTYFKELCITT